MSARSYSISARVWIYKGDSPWHFVTIEKSDADKIKMEYPFRKGFGSIPITATICSTSWKTSIFPDKNGTFVLPLKKEVREKEKIKVGDVITIKMIVAN